MKIMSNKKNKMFARIMSFFVMAFAFLPFAFIGVSNNSAFNEPVNVILFDDPTTEGVGGDINDLNVVMNDDGTLSIEGIGDGDSKSSWATLFEKGKVFLAGILGIATLVLVAFFIKNFIALGASADNPQARRGAVAGILGCGIAAACCGALLIIVGLFWNAFK